MKKRHIVVAIIVSLGLAVAASLAVASLIYDYRCNGNCVTIISGLWSAAATAAIGGVAYWQNERYKKLADEANDAMQKPEIYYSTSYADEHSAVFEEYRAHVKGFINRNEGYKCSSIIHLFFVRGPILNLYIKTIKSKSEILTCIDIEPVSMRDEATPFNLSFEVPKEWLKPDNEITITLAYENICAVQYEKEIRILLYPEDLTVNRISFEKARRV